MNQANVSKLVSKLKYNLKDRRKLRSPQGPQGRHDKIRKTVTALFKYERIELNYRVADESRGYAERLISDAIRYGDCHKETMEMASYWLLEKQLVHKLFKVLAPRYEKFSLSYTKLWKVPTYHNDVATQKCVLELRNNIYPPLGPDKTNHQNLIHNILLNEAKKHFNKEKALKILQDNNELLKEMKKTESSLEKDFSNASDQAVAGSHEEEGEKSELEESFNKLKMSESEPELLPSKESVVEPQTHSLDESEKDGNESNEVSNEKK